MARTSTLPTSTASTSSLEPPGRRSSAATACGCTRPTAGASSTARAAPSCRTSATAGAEVADAVRDALDGGAYVIPIWPTPHRERLHDILVERWLPAGMGHVFFTSGGSESADSAIRLARAYHLACGRPERWQVVGRHPSYHGLTLGALAVGSHRNRRAGFDPILPGLPARAVGRRRARWRSSSRGRADSIAAFLFEPITGAAGGCLEAPDEYWRSGRRRVPAPRHPADRRRGDDRASAAPACRGATTSCRSSPTCCTAARASAAATSRWAWSRRPTRSSTRCAAAASCSSRSRAATRCAPAPSPCSRSSSASTSSSAPRRWATILGARLRDALGSHPAVVDVRGRGMFHGVELHPSDGAFARAVVAEAMSRDLWVYPAGSGPPVPDAIMLGPAFTISDVEVDTLVERLAASIDAATRADTRRSVLQNRPDRAGHSEGQVGGHGPARGSTSVRRAPPSGASPISRRPPWAAATSDVTARPRPAPPPSRAAALVEADEAPHDVAPLGRRDARAVVVDDHPDLAVGRLDRRRAPPMTAWRAALATRWSTARSTAPRSPTTGSTSVAHRRPRPAPAGIASRRRAPRRRSRTRAVAKPRSSPRASSSRSSTRPCSRSSSASSTLARGPSQSASAARRATSSSARITATGVRSSCDASDDETAVRRRRRLEPGEHPVHRRRQLGDLVARRRHGHPFVQRPRPDGRDPRRHRVHRPQRPPGEQPGQPGDERHERRAGDPQQPLRRGDRVAHRVERRRGGQRELAGVDRRHRVVGHVAADAEHAGLRHRQRAGVRRRRSPAGSSRRRSARRRRCVNMTIALRPRQRQLERLPTVGRHRDRAGRQALATDTRAASARERGEIGRCARRRRGRPRGRAGARTRRRRA